MHLSFADYLLVFFFLQGILQIQTLIMVRVQLFTCGNVRVLHIIIVIIIHIADYDITEINTILQLMKSVCYIVDRQTVCGSYVIIYCLHVLL